MYQSFPFQAPKNKVFEHLEYYFFPDSTAHFCNLLPGFTPDLDKTYSSLNHKADDSIPSTHLHPIVKGKTVYCEFSPNRHRYKIRHSRKLFSIFILFFPNLRFCHRIIKIYMVLYYLIYILVS